MNIYDRITAPIAKQVANNMIADLSKTRIAKADAQGMVVPANGSGILRYTFDPVYVNSNYYNKKKPDSSISFDVLRNFSLKYEIARACVNLRKRQLSGMEWDIVTAETDDTNDYTDDILAVKEFFTSLGGTINPDGSITGGSYRRFMNMSIEDVMVLDALAYYKVRDRTGKLITLIPVDGSTVRLMIDGTGSAPPPPEIAYKQVIRGTVTAEWTTDDLHYDMMNPRANSPYGLSPLESLMITVSAALKSGLYNLGYLTDGNIPEGIIEAPTNWSATMIREFQANFDAALAGDSGATSKLKMLPNDSKYVPTKKPTDMAFGEMNTWLMELTCSVYDVMPIDIGFPPKGRGLGSGSGDKAQKETSNDKGLRPIANMLEEIYNEVIQVELGFPHLKFNFSGLESENIREAAEVNQMLIMSGQRTINEVRTDDGIDAIDGGDALFVFGAGTPLPLNQEALDLVNNAMADPENHGKKNEGTPGDEDADTRARAADAKNKKQPGFEDSADAADNDPDNSKADRPDEAFIKLVSEMRTMRKYVKNRMAVGKPLRAFESAVLPQATMSEINKRLGKAVDFEEADTIIKEYMSDYQIRFISKVNKLREDLGVLV